MTTTRHSWRQRWSRPRRLGAMVVGVLLGLGLVPVLAPTQRAPALAATAEMARLVVVSGNNQLGQPGEILREPLVVRLEDQFGTPLVGVEVTGQIIAGEGRLVGCPPDGDVTQDAQVTPDDALRAFEHFLGRTHPPLDACAQAQANVLEPERSAITPADALCIFQRFLGLPSCGNALTAGGQRPPAAGVLQGNGETTRTERTDANGIARFFLRVGAREETIVTRVAALEQEVQFQSFIVALVSPVAVAVEPDGSLVVADSGLGAVVRVSPSTGDVTLVSRLGRGTGPPLGIPAGIAVAPDGALVVLAWIGEFSSEVVVVRVHPVTGDRTVLSGCAAFDVGTFSCTTPLHGSALGHPCGHCGGARWRPRRAGGDRGRGRRSAGASGHGRTCFGLGFRP